MALQIPAHGHVELLIGAPQLQIGLNRHRVVTLEQRIKKFVQGDRCTSDVAIRKILLGQHLTNGGDAQQLNHLGQVEAGQPFAVAAHLQAPRGFEIQQGSLGILALA